jgi:arylsulfatase A-like enzyme
MTTATTFLRSSLVAAAAAVGLVATLTLQAVLSASCQVAVTPRETRPNIVVIVFDDLDVALAQRLPEWRLLEQQGLRFDHAVVTTPLCCPSRVSILNGRYAHNHGVIGNDVPDGGHQRALEMGVERCTVAVWLQQAGYTTALMGKYLNGYGFETLPSEIPAGWDRWAAMWRDTGVTAGNYVLNVDGILQSPPRYQTDELTQRALRFMSEAESAGTPFFLYLTPGPPHKPWHPPQRYADASTGGYPIPDRYRTMLAGVELAQDVIEAAPEDTFVIVTSDNGYHLRPAPGKGEPRWIDVHVPFIVMGPDIDPGESDDLVANIDIAPTVADWAGIEVATGVDGASLRPLLGGDATDWRTEVTVELVGFWQGVVTQTEMRGDRGEEPDDVIDLR